MSSSRPDRIYSEIEALKEFMARSQEAGLSRALRSSGSNSALVQYPGSALRREAAARAREAAGGARRERPAAKHGKEEKDGKHNAREARDARRLDKKEMTGVFSAWMEKRWMKD